MPIEPCRSWPVSHCGDCSLAWCGRAITQREPVDHPWLEQIRQSFYPGDDDDDDDDNDDNDNNDDNNELQALNGSMSYDEPIPRPLAIVGGNSNHIVMEESQVDADESIRFDGGANSSEVGWRTLLDLAVPDVGCS